MINGQRLAVVLPAYNAARTLAATVAELPDIVDDRILVDDGEPRRHGGDGDAGSDCRRSCTTRTTDTAAIRPPAIAKR